MSTTESTTPTSSSTFQSTPTTAVTNDSPDASLGKDAFLQLLTTEMENQDPTQPTDDTEFVSELAQFSSLEQATDTNQSINSLVSTTSVDQALELIGKNVTYTGSDGSTDTGLADGVTIGDDGTVTVDVGGVAVDPSSISTVGQTSTSTDPGSGSSGSDSSDSGANSSSQSTSPTN